MSDWWLAIWYGRHCRYPCLYTLHRFPVPLHPTLYTKSASDHAFTRYTLRFTLLTPATLPLTSRLIASFTCLLAVFWRRCRRQMQERYEVARVKTTEEFEEHYKFDRREISSMKGSENIGVCSKNIAIVFGATLWRRMREIEMDKTGAVKSYLNGLWISHLSGDA